MKSNPLSTRFVAPGKLAWRASTGLLVGELFTRFTNQLNSRAAIVGPHGSGKSTLLETLVPLLGTVQLRASTYEQPSRRPFPVATANASRDDLYRGEDKRRIVWLTLRGRSASRRLLFRTYRLWANRNSVLVIDGYEQLSAVARGAVLLLTHINGAGVLITSHRPAALATLVETQVDVALAQQLIEELLPEDTHDRDRFLDADRLQRLLDKHHGNLREVFMELYDEFSSALPAVKPLRNSSDSRPPR